MNGMVTMKDYEGFGGGFGGYGSAADMPALFGMTVEQFQKALAANYQSPRMEGSAALRVESLEQTLRVITFQSKHIVFWHDIPKGPAYSTSHEYNIQTSYGIENGGFTRAGEAPQVQDSSYGRKTVLLKYLTTQREVDHPTTLVRSAHGNVLANQTRDGALWLLMMAERAMHQGRSDVVPESIDGFDRLLRQETAIAQQNIIDLRGGPITYDRVEEMTNIIEQNYGYASDLYLSPRALSDLGKQQQAKEKYLLPAPQQGVIGMGLKAVETQSGAQIQLKKDIFLRPGKNNGQKYAPSAATATRAPAAASVSGAASASTSQFGAADIGTYQYKVTAINRFGESAAAQESGGVAISAANDIVTLTITDGGGGDAATGYVIYRSLVGGAAGTEMEIDRVQRQGATTTWVDTNRYLPTCGRAYEYQMNDDCCGIVQLAPMFKVPFATIALSIRWAQGMYLATVLRAPGKMGIFDNVADE